MRCYYERITNVISIDFNTFYTFSLQIKNYEFFATFRVECRFNKNNRKFGLPLELNYSRDRMKNFQRQCFP